jgi:acyl carrier protein
VTAPMTLEEFCGYLARRLDLEPGALTPDVDIRTGLGLDSIQMYILLIAIEDLGVQVPEALMPHILTLRDAFAQYQNGIRHSA